MIFKITRFLVYFIPFAIVLFLIQQFVLDNFFSSVDFYNSSVSIYVFLSVTFLASFVLFLLVSTFFFNQSGYAFMALGIVKMIASILFLIPLINSNKEDKSLDVLAFFVPFFLFLLFETIQTVKILNRR